MSTLDPSSSGLYNVDFTDFALRYHVKAFEKRYGRAWDITRRAIEAALQRADALILTSKLDAIHQCDGHKIGKMYFAVAGRKESAKTAGNRAIVHIDEGLRLVRVLLVYSKNEICSPNETQKWEAVVRKAHAETWKLFDS